jgi:SAM-dependent methyltransferase
MATPPDPALTAYEALAADYDAFTAGYAHEPWLAAIERELIRAGLRGRRVLDVACGTGKSTLPLVRRGYDVTACDISPAMVVRARRRLRLPPERVFTADMRRLPRLAPFDAATCLDDAVNYLLTDADLRAALGSIRGVLAPGGLLAFDVNSYLTYRTAFVGEFTRANGGRRFRWRGAPAGPLAPGAAFTATLETGAGAAVHRQRHHRPAAIAAAIAGAGLRTVRVFGQAPGGRLLTPPDESRHPKLLFLAGRPPADREEAR